MDSLYTFSRMMRPQPRSGRISRGLLGLSLGLSLPLAIGCGGGGSGGGPSGTISSGPLSGTIGGQPWTFATGQTDFFLSTDSQYFVDTYAATFTACTDVPPADAYDLIMIIPKTVGSYALGQNLSATFSMASTNTNVFATSGQLVIDSITATTISGGAKFAAGADNTVDGQFEATLCP
jgi:hypothetical protein